MIFQPPTPDLRGTRAGVEGGCANPAEQYAPFLEISTPYLAHIGVRGGAVTYIVPHTYLYSSTRTPPHPSLLLRATLAQLGFLAPMRDKFIKLCLPSTGLWLSLYA